MVSGVVFQVSIKPSVQGERGLPKRPVESAFLNENGFVGDFNHYRTNKKDGDNRMAVLVIPLETLLQLQFEGWPVKPGELGENVTTKGIRYEEFIPGQQYRVGNSIIEISKPATPCKNLASLPYIGNEKLSAFMRVLINRRGWYAKVVCEGEIRNNDNIVGISI